jgi:hypothetical protein
MVVHETVIRVCFLFRKMAHDFGFSWICFTTWFKTIEMKLFFSKIGVSRL